MLPQSPVEHSGSVGDRTPSPARRTTRRLFATGLLTVPALALGAHFLRPSRGRAAHLSVGDAVIVDADFLNLRDAAGLDAEVIDVLPFDTRATVTALPEDPPDDDHDWYQIETEDGAEGWVAGEHLILDDGSGDEDDTGDGLFAIGDEVVVNTDGLNFRTGPGLDVEVIEVLAFGTEGTVTAVPDDPPADDWTWYEIETAGAAVGWVAGEYLALASDDGDDADDGGDDDTGAVEVGVGDYARVATDELNLRDGPSLDAGVIEILPNGAGVSIYDGPESADGYTWFTVSTDDGVDGWVAGELLAAD